MKWFELLNKNEVKRIHMLCGALHLQNLNEYESLEHFLYDVYCKILESKSLIKQAYKILGDE